MTEQNKKLFASILFLLISFICIGQEEPPPPGPPAPGLPIDGGVLFGMIFALFYGVRKLLLGINNNR